MDDCTKPFKGSMEETSKESTELALPMEEEFGKSLIRATLDAEQEETKRFLIIEMQNIRKYYEEACEGIFICTKQKAYYQKIYHAIVNGEFRITAKGNIVFNDGNLKFGRYVVPGQYRTTGDGEIDLGFKMDPIESWPGDSKP